MVMLLMLVAVVLLLVLLSGRRQELPIVLTLFNLIPLSIAPVLLSISAFFLDDPNAGWGAYAAFFAVNSYPFLILAAMYGSFRLYRQGRRGWAWVPPAVFHGINLCFLAWLFVH